MTFAEVVENLHQYNEVVVGARAPAIYVAEPWAALSEATVEWSGEKGGVPCGRKPILFFLTTVKAALSILGSEYAVLVANGETEALCSKLAHHVIQMNAQRVRHDADIERINIDYLDQEFSKIAPDHASSAKGFAVIFHPAGGLDYVDVDGVIRVDTVLYVKPYRFAIYRESRCLIGLDHSRKKEILANVVRAMAFLGRATELV